MENRIKELEDFVISINRDLEVLEKVILLIYPRLLDLLDYEVALELTEEIEMIVVGDNNE